MSDGVYWKEIQKKTEKKNSKKKKKLINDNKKEIFALKISVGKTSLLVRYVENTFSKQLNYSQSHVISL